MPTPTALPGSVTPLLTMTYPDGPGADWKTPALPGLPRLPIVASDSLRVVTYNTQMTSPGFFPDGCCEHIPGRPAKLAERIVAGDYDVIVLQEVFDEDDRAALITALAPLYPHFVARLDDDAVGVEDSGLMLFSRFPFLPLPSPAYRAELDDALAWSSARGFSPATYAMCTGATAGFLGSLCESAGRFRDVAYHEFDAHTGEDGWAAKGAGLVRINHPGGRVYAVVFTHLQAAGAFWYREAQLAETARMVTTTLGAQLASDEVLMMGDLNIDGRASGPAAACEGDATGVASTRCSWERTLGPAGIPFFHDTLRDAWEYETAADDVPVDRRDPGLTGGVNHSPSSHQRLDYLLRNRPTASPINARLCVQHMRVAYDLRWDGELDLSDHYGVAADLNTFVPGCSPREAHRGVRSDAPVTGAITLRGGMQWYRFDDPGTWSIAVEGDGAWADVYDAADLSTPLADYRGETRALRLPDGKVMIGVTYQVPRAPFYVRVSTARAGTVPVFTLLAHRHAGATLEDAVVLLPNDPVTQALPTGAYGPVDNLWFRLDTEGADSGRPQELRWWARAADGGTGAYKVVVRARPAATTLGDVVAASTTGAVTRRDEGNDHNSFFFQVVAPPGAPRVIEAGWQTDLNVLHAWSDRRVELSCIAQTEGDGPEIIGEDDDRVTLWFELASGAWSSRQERIREDIDRGEIWPVRGITPIYFLADEALQPTLWEHDDADDGDRLWPYAEPALDDGARRAITPLSPTEARAWNRPAPGQIDLYETDRGLALCAPFSTEWCWTKGHYRLYYRLSHGLQATMAP
jgi:endonuclease/exonuclease/phosphatase family metal-dependent hydrolase